MPRSSLALKLSAVAVAIALVVIGGSGLLSVYAGPPAQVTIAVTLPPIVNTLLPGPTAVPPTAGSGNNPTSVPPTAGSGNGSTAIAPTAGSGNTTSGANATTVGNTAPTAANGATTAPKSGSGFTALICNPTDLVDTEPSMSATMDASMSATMDVSMNPTVEASAGQNAVYLGITVRQTAACGAQIIEVVDDSPASAAKLQLNDVIVAVDVKATPSTGDLQEAIEGHQPGDAVTLTVTRDKKLVSVKVTLGTKPVLHIVPSAPMSASMQATMDAMMNATMEGTMSAPMEATMSATTNP